MSDQILDAIERAETTPAVVIDMNRVRQIRNHNRAMAAFETLSGIPTPRVNSIKEMDELEERLGVLIW